VTSTQQPAAAPQPPVARRPRSDATDRLYGRDLRRFSEWCRAQGRDDLPAAPETVAAYLASCAHAPAAQQRRASAIADAHRRRGLPSPCRDPAVRAALRDARRARPAPRLPYAARLRRGAARMPGDLRGLRDRALMLLAAEGLEPARLVALDIEHLEISPQGLRVADGHSPALRVARGQAPCATQALEAWLAASGRTFGEAFCRLDARGAPTCERLSASSIPAILSRRLRRSRGAHP